jgi:hypothetical protein
LPSHAAPSSSSSAAVAVAVAAAAALPLLRPLRPQSHRRCRHRFHRALAVMRA